MNEKGNLQRFLEAQETTYATALAELKNGRKRTHWMWFIFPQIQGLGFSATSRFYGIQSAREAEAYLNDDVLGARLLEVCEALLELESTDALKVLGSPDDIKLKSCMTLFATLNRSPVFEAVLAKFFNGEMDQATLNILYARKHES